MQFNGVRSERIARKTNPSDILVRVHVLVFSLLIRIRKFVGNLLTINIQQYICILFLILTLVWKSARLSLFIRLRFFVVICRPYMSWHFFLSTSLRVGDMLERNVFLSQCCLQLLIAISLNFPMSEMQTCFSVETKREKMLVLVWKKKTYTFAQIRTHEKYFFF